MSATLIILTSLLVIFTVVTTWICVKEKYQKEISNLFNESDLLLKKIYDLQGERVLLNQQIYSLEKDLTNFTKLTLPSYAKDPEFLEIPFPIDSVDKLYELSNKAYKNSTLSQRHNLWKFVVESLIDEYPEIGSGKFELITDDILRPVIKCKIENKGE